MIPFTSGTVTVEHSKLHRYGRSFLLFLFGLVVFTGYRFIQFRNVALSHVHATEQVTGTIRRTSGLGRAMANIVAEEQKEARQYERIVHAIDKHVAMVFDKLENQVKDNPDDVTDSYLRAEKNKLESFLNEKMSHWKGDAEAMEQMRVHQLHKISTIQHTAFDQALKVFLRDSPQALVKFADTTLLSLSSTPGLRFTEDFLAQLTEFAQRVNDALLLGEKLEKQVVKQLVTVFAQLGDSVDMRNSGIDTRFVRRLQLASAHSDKTRNWDLKLESIRNILEDIFDDVEFAPFKDRVLEIQNWYQEVMGPLKQAHQQNSRDAGVAARQVILELHKLGFECTMIAERLRLDSFAPDIYT